MTTLHAAAALLLVLAVSWKAALSLADCRTVVRRYPGGRAYRLGRGWTGPAEFVAQRRLALYLLAGSATLLTALGFHRAAPGPASTAVYGTCCVLMLPLILVERRRTGCRFTTICVAELAAALGLLALPGPGPVAAGLFASFFAVQLYLVAGIRKLRSPHFISGGVLIDNLAYNAVQAAAGNRDFPAWPRLNTLSAILTRPALHHLSRGAAIATAAAEITLGLAALGLLPAPAALTLAVLMHGAFLLLSPWRIVPFSAASLGLLLLATTHPLLAAFTP
ncbi:hypothetical protein TR51_17145 [Kitasatospora griseola]|uniref:HTTM domain-containing protein n=1 Tax=Kitasatospora griseola TaxID=2064 RepID=A0A0D0PSQ4_KITGR|nr:hypothetical protein [Kitasatospora griseola]KIQ65564.1 hypothetical protein TR51_17145 [Kitasatospora griseola]